jgi:HPr kinase/phosphorylase
MHATAIAVNGRAALIRGPSGSGKSDLAVRCLSLAPSALVAASARLVADDQVILRRQGLALFVSAPPQIAGKLEVRGLGIVEMAAEPGCKAVLVVDLVARDMIERQPDPWPKARILGLDVPILRLWPFAASAPAVLLLALTWDKLPTLGHQT